MKTRWPRILLCILALTTASAPAPADEPAVDAGAADVGPPVATLASDPPGTEKSPLPKVADWTRATPVAIEVEPGIQKCSARRLREWLRIRCNRVGTAAIAMVAGNSDGVSLWIDEDRGEAVGFPRAGEIQLPMRRGDRRVFDVREFGDGGYNGPGFPVHGLMVTEEWLEDQPAPIVRVF